MDRIIRVILISWGNNLKVGGQGGYTINCNLEVEES